MEVITGRDLRLARDAQGVGLGKLAVQIGRDKGHLSRVERSMREVTPAVVRDYERVLGVKIAATPNMDVDDPNVVTVGDMKRRGLLGAITAASVGATFFHGPPRLLLRMAAHDSELLSSGVEGSALGPVTLDNARDDLRRLANEYIVTSDIPRILTDALLLRDRLSSLIELRRPRPREAREVYVMLGAVCLLLASISHDCGEPEAGIMQARSAETFANLAEYPELLGWALCTKAMIDLWRQQRIDVLKHAARADAVGITGSGRLRLEGLRIRALAQLNRPVEAQALLDRVEDRSGDDESGTLDDLGAFFSFPETRRVYYSAVSHALLGNYDTAVRRVTALGHDDRPPTNTGSWPVSWALGRSYLALASLDYRGSTGGPDAAARALAPVFELPEVQRVHQLGQVFGDIGQRLQAPMLRGNAAATALSDAVRCFPMARTPEVTAS